MKKTIFGQLTILFMLGACNLPSFLQNNKEPKMEAKVEANVEKKADEESPKIGGDKDEHGCFISAGYSWSPTRKECVRIWEAGVRLVDLKVAESPISVIIIENGEQGPLEVYLPQNSAPLIMEKDGEDWSDKKEEYLVKKINGKFQVFDKNDKLIAKN